MTSIKRFACLLMVVFCSALLMHSAWAEPNTLKEFTETKVSAKCASYNTELFNLVVNRKNIIDGKNYYQKSFASVFDSLLSESAFSKSKPEFVQLKKRLLSGPAGKPKAFDENATGKTYLYFEACQAHDCGQTRLGLLYETQSKILIGRLLVKGQEEILGRPSDFEKNMLKTLAPSAAKGSK